MSYLGRRQIERDRYRDGLLGSYGWETLRLGKYDVGFGLPRGTGE